MTHFLHETNAPYPKGLVDHHYDSTYLSRMLECDDDATTIVIVRVEPDA